MQYGAQIRIDRLKNNCGRLVRFGANKMPPINQLLRAKNTCTAKFPDFGIESPSSPECPNMTTLERTNRNQSK